MIKADPKWPVVSADQFDNAKKTAEGLETQAGIEKKSTEKQAELNKEITALKERGPVVKEKIPLWGYIAGGFGALLGILGLAALLKRKK